MISLLAAADPMDEILPHTLFHLGAFAFTNQMFMTIVAALLVLLVFPYLFPHPDDSVPTGAKNFFESILEFLRVEVIRPALKEHTDRFLPFLWTLFFFILFSNLLSQVPVGEIVTLFTHRPFEWWGTATGTPITTGALALCAFVFIHLSGILQIARSLMDGTYGHHAHHEEHSSTGHSGHEAAADMQHSRGDALAADLPNDFSALTNPSAHYADDQHHSRQDQPRLVPGHDHYGPAPKMNPVLAILAAMPLYLWNFAPHPFKPAPGTGGFMAAFQTVADIFMWAFLLVLELIGAAIKPFALMIRLFANMIAGHIVLASLVLLIPLAAGAAAQIGAGIPVTVLALIIRCLELFVCFLQAYVFTFLVTLFIASAVAPEH